MLLMLRYPSGRLAEAIALAGSPDRLRAVIRRVNETIDLCRENGKWTDHLGRRVEVEGWVVGSSIQFADLFSESVRPLTMSAH